MRFLLIATLVPLTASFASTPTPYEVPGGLVLIRDSYEFDHAKHPMTGFAPDSPGPHKLILGRGTASLQLQPDRHSRGTQPLPAPPAPPRPPLVRLRRHGPVPPRLVHLRGQDQAAVVDFGARQLLWQPDRGPCCDHPALLPAARLL
eukprot:scaffold23356_cov69-Phaeocystis_antarctica.AAC.1